MRAYYAFSLLLIVGMGAFSGAPLEEEKHTFLVTTAISPLFAGPGPYYELATVLPAGFVIEVPEEVAANPRWWMLVRGFPHRESEFEKLTSSRVEGQKHRGLWISVRNVKPESAPFEGISEEAVPPVVLGELEASGAIRGFIDLIAISPAGQSMTRTDLAFVLRLPFSPGQMRAFRDARVASRPQRTVRPEPSGSDQLDFLSRLQVGLAVLNRLSKRLEGKIMQDEGIDRYLNLVAAHVAENSPSYDLRFRVILWGNDELRGAYSTPGGFIVITTGLLRECGDEAELAGLIAHEMAHVYFEHGLKVKEYAEKATGISDLHDLESELDKSVEEIFGLPPEWQLDNYAHLEDMAADFLEKTLLKGYLVKDEREADEFAAVALYNCGYDPRALGCLLLRTKEENDSRAFLTNHGPASDRIRILSAAIEDLGLSNPNACRFEEIFKSEVASYSHVDECGTGLTQEERK